MITKTTDKFDRQEELLNCNFVKTILMLIVVIYHSCIFWAGGWFSMVTPQFSAPIISQIALWTNTFHIYAFALVSGYIFYHLKYEKGRYEKFWPFVLNKAKRLLIPYAVVSIAWVIPVSSLFYKVTFKDILKNYVLGISPGQLWFLLMLFVLFVVFFPLSKFFKENDIFGAVVVVAFYGVGLIVQLLNVNFFQIFRAFTYVPLFWLGFKIRQHGSLCIKKIPSLIWVVADLLLFALYTIISKYDGAIFALLQKGVYFVLCVVGALMAFVVLQEIAGRVKWKESSVFKFLSKNSMPVYLFHQQIIYVIIYYLNGVVNPYIHVAINGLGSLVVSLIISALLMKFKWTRALIGEK